jgi:uncharacterized membrane protein (UPF0127 family)
MTFQKAVVLAVLAAMPIGCRAEPQATTSRASAQPGAVRTAPSGLALIPLEISSRGRRHAFTVEVARTSGEQAQGLMFRQRLGANEGMLFPFPSPRPASFWMKNTLIPLDMIFIRSDGSIARVAANTVPGSLDPVAVGEPVAAVLELRGGRAAELGIGEGDRVSWPGGPSRPAA